MNQEEIEPPKIVDSMNSEATIKISNSDGSHNSAESFIEKVAYKDIKEKPSSESMNLVYLDHQYLASWSESSSNSDFSDDDENLQENLQYASTSKPTPSGFQGHLRSILTGSLEFAKNKFKHAISTLMSAKPEADVDPSIPNADDIQRHFQDTMAMTSFQPIADLDTVAELAENSEMQINTTDQQATKVINRAYSAIDVFTAKSSQKAMDCSVGCVSSSDDIANLEKQKKVRKSASVPTSCNRTLDYKEWLKIRRDTQEEVQFNSLLAHAMTLMVQKWAEYLTFTTDQMQKFELENARNEKMCDEVIEMLEDRDRYVWQLIEDL